MISKTNCPIQKTKKHTNNGGKKTVKLELNSLDPSLLNIATSVMIGRSLTLKKK